MTKTPTSAFNVQRSAFLAQPSAFSLQRSAFLFGIWLLAFALRGLYIWQISDAPFFDLRIGDADAYHAWARRIAEGDWIGHDVFYQAPLYPYFLAVVYRILGDSVLIVRIVQAVVGATSCALLASAGMALFGRAGALAGLGLAIYPSAIFLDGLLEKSALVTFFMTAVLALVGGQTGVRPGSDPDVRVWVAAGVVFGLLTLTRENALLLAVPILLWIARRANETRRARTAIGFVAGCGIVLLPVGFRNLAVGGTFHLTTAQFGPNFYIGNHSGAKGTYEALVPGHGSAADEREDATRLAEQAAGRKLTPAEVSSFWTARSLDYIRSQPVAWLKLLARKLALTFNAAEVADTESQDIYAEWSPLLRALRPFSFGVLLGCAALGLVLTAYRWRELWLLYAIGATYALTVIIFYVFARYRFPLVPVLLLLATGGVVELRGAAGRVGLAAVAAVTAILAAAFAHLSVEDPRVSRATHAFDIAAVLAKDPARREQSLRFYERALAEVPGFPPAHSGLATVLASMGRPEEAIAHYRAALDSWPDHADARYNLGLVLAKLGRAQEAADELSAALRIRPDDPEIHVALAKTLVPLDRPEEAIAHYRRALDLDPRNSQVHNNLGAALANLGRLAEALPHFERAVALDSGDENARKNLELARRMKR